MNRFQRVSPCDVITRTCVYMYVVLLQRKLSHEQAQLYNSNLEALETAYAHLTVSLRMPSAYTCTVETL